CTVTTPSVDVPMGDHDKSEFSGAGSSTDWVSFDIGLSCDVGARINVRIDATADASAGSQGVMLMIAAGRPAWGYNFITARMMPLSSTVRNGFTGSRYMVTRSCSLRRDITRLQAQSRQVRQTVRRRLR
ncbi:TPA: type 1 fimbrial protein, partial [Citrobacter farmeri]|nr:type 1 fimbrial protein [Citrobacter farmeri]